MRMIFPSDMPIWEQLQRSAKRKQVGRKHNHTLGPGSHKRQPPRDQKRKAALRKFQEQVALYFRGLRDTYPAKPV